MILSRPLSDSDTDVLMQSIEQDPYHAGTTAEFFRAYGTMCNVYEDEQGPVLFCRGTKSLRLDLQFVNNREFQRNRDMMLAGFPDMMEKAKAAGFTEIVFFSTSPLLTRFCKQKLGFNEVAGELRRLL